MPHNIQVFTPSFRIEEVLSEIRVCLERGWTGLGFKTVEFEEAWKAYTGLPHAHFLSSATAGLDLAVEILKVQDGWKDGDEIISTPLTFVSTNHAVIHAGMRVVFADVDEYLTLDPISIASRITERTRAVMYVGLGGNIGQLDKVVALCKKHGLRLILDAAHMSGTRVNGRHVGSEADVANFSYQAVKNLPTADSGMICFREKELDEMVHKWSWLGISKDTFTRTSTEGTYKWYYDVEYPGYKAHGNSIMAAMALVGLRYLDHDNAYRRQIASWYTEMLGGESGIKTIPQAVNCESAQHLYQVLVENRDEVIFGLNQRGIYPGVHYRDNTVYAMYGYAAGTCPKAAHASDHTITLPIHLVMQRADVEYVAESLKSIIRMKRGNPG